VGDGVTDDTQAIKDAIASTFNAWEQIYFPEGTYLVSDEIFWKRFLTLRGDGPGKTIVRLANNAPGYQDVTNTKAIFFCRESGRNEANNNGSHSNFIFNLTIEVGSGNPGALAVDFSSHNGGGIENVRIVDLDNALTGISLERDSPGPALIKNVEVVGFDYGIRTRYGVYSMTFEDITLRDQRVTGFYNGQHNASIRGLQSSNQVPAITLENGRTYGLLVLLDAQLNGGANDATAIVGDGEILARNISASGYGTILRNGSTVLSGSNIEEYSSSPILDSDGNTVATLNLSVPTAPPVPVADLSDWVNVRDYQNLVVDGDWGPAIQAAIDAGKSTVYFPNKTHASYPTEQTVYVRGNVRRIVGLYARLGERGGSLVCQNKEPLVLEQVRADGGIIHQGEGALILKRCMSSRLETRPGTGDVFVEDWCCGSMNIDHTNVYVSQLNNESTDMPKITNNGGTLVVLNLKTEQPSQVAYSLDGAKTEVLGGLIYPVQGGPTTPMYRTEDASLGAYHRELGPSYPHFLEKDGALIAPSFSRGTRFVEAEAVATPFPDPNKWYVLKNRDSGLNMRNANCAKDRQTLVELVSWTGNCAQWRFVPKGDYWHIENRDSGLRIRNAGCQDTSDKTLVELWDGTGNCTQWSIIAAAEDGYYHLKNRDANLNIRNEDCESVNDETRVELYNGTGSCAQWQLIAVGDYNARSETTVSKAQLPAPLPSFTTTPQLYPNPAADDLRVQLEDEGSARLVIRDLYGRIVLDQLVRAGEHTDVRHLPAGLYQARLEQAATITTRKLLIAR
jgi:hypothetical protein